MRFSFWQNVILGRCQDEAGGEEAPGQSGGAPPDKKEDVGEGEKKPSMSESEAKLLKEVMKKKQQIQELESGLKEAREKLNEFSGIDASEIRKLLAEREDKEKSELERRGEWDALKERMAKEHKAERDALAAKLTELTERLSNGTKTIEALTVGHQFDNSTLVREDLVLTPRKAKAIYGAYFDVDDDGNITGYDKPAGSHGRTALVDSSGSPLSFDEALRRLIDSDPDKDDLYRSKKRPGAGSNPSKGPPSTGTRKLSAVELIEQGLKDRKK